MEETILTYQQYKNRKVELLQTTYKLALDQLYALEALEADLRDDDWEAYHALLVNDIRRLASQLPLFMLAKMAREESA